MKGLSNESKRTFAQVIGDTSEQVHSEVIDKWTPNMKEFYDKIDPKMADADIDQILDEMPSNKEYWIVRKPHSTPNRRYDSCYYLEESKPSFSSESNVHVLNSYYNTHVMESWTL